MEKLGKNLQGKTIAVYGASSNIGKRFTEEAARRGATVIAVARDIRKVPSQPKGRTLGRIEVVQGDITRRKDVLKVLRDRKVYATVNFAVDFSPHISKARKVNVIGEQYILEASNKFGVKRHIYISTVATLTPKPSAYRDTKLEAENAVKAAGKKYHLDWIILRFANVLGTKTWDQPFKIIIPHIRLAVPKVPTDAKESSFYYVTINTAVESTLASLQSRPNQIITVFDGKITIGEYLAVMENVYAIRRSFLPSKPLKLLAKYLGKYSLTVEGLSAGVEFMAHPPAFENETMKRELNLKTKNFQKWVKGYFPEHEKKSI